MIIKIIKIIILVLMILNGAFFITNIYVLGDREAAIEMHDDLVPTTGAFMANTKVVVCFVVGILYLMSAIGIIRKKYSLAMAGFIGFIIFNGLYVTELIMWARIHPRIWIDFSIFGGLSLIYGVYSWWYWRKRQLISTQLKI